MLVTATSAPPICRGDVAPKILGGDDFDRVGGSRGAEAGDESKREKPSLGEHETTPRFESGELLCYNSA